MKVLCVCGRYKNMGFVNSVLLLKEFLETNSIINLQEMSGTQLREDSVNMFYWNQRGIENCLKPLCVWKIREVWVIKV